jgi:hypothetical protein
MDKQSVARQNLQQYMIKVGIHCLGIGHVFHQVRPEVEKSHVVGLKGLDAKTN